MSLPTSKAVKSSFLSCTIALLAFPLLGGAQQLNFSGTYVLVGASGQMRYDPKQKDLPILKVVQTSDELRTEWTNDKGTETMALPLNGDEAAFTTLDGESARAHVETGKKQFRIRTVIPMKNGPRSTYKKVEIWKLSEDGKKLKIIGNSEVRGGLGDFVPLQFSWSQTFKRQ